MENKEDLKSRGPILVSVGIAIIVGLSTLFGIFIPAFQSGDPSKYFQDKLSGVPGIAFYILIGVGTAFLVLAFLYRIFRKK